MTQEDNSGILGSCIICGHTTTWHDGGIAILKPNGEIIALSSERVGDRVKHSWNSTLAYDVLKVRLEKEGFTFDYDCDFFKSEQKDSKEVVNQRDHHRFHAAIAFFGSPFKEATVLVMDGQGPENGLMASTTIWHGNQNGLKLLEMPYATNGSFAPQSIGHFYTAIGILAGMQHLHEEGKTMGLAAYGDPSHFLTFIRRHAYTRDDGSYYINPLFVEAIFGHTLGPKLYGWGKPSKEAKKLWLEIKALRTSPSLYIGEGVTQDDMNIAYAGQMIVEEIVTGLARRAINLTGSQNVCMAGGVALNSVANGKLLDLEQCSELYIPPAPGDEGQALGKLLNFLHSTKKSVDTHISTAYLGPVYTDSEIDLAISQYSDKIEVVHRGDGALDYAANLLMNGYVIGWYHGQSELGPRALGHRSILGDPRLDGMREYINKHIKHREWYRPLAPVVLEEFASEYFDIANPVPFMSLVAKVRKEKRYLIPAVTHVDGTARLQTISQEQDVRFYSLIKEFGKLSGLPMLLNTSFNRRNEPIVETPENALEAFIEMGLDALVIEDIVIVTR